MTQALGSTCDLCRVRGDHPAEPTIEQIPIAIRDLQATLCVCARHRAEVDRVAENVMLIRRSRSSEGFPRLRADESRSVIRSWAQNAELPVSSSGTISAAVLQAYREAHGTQRKNVTDINPPAT